MRGLRRWILRALLAGAVLVLVLVLFAHPYFAVTRPSGGDVLVAEGWMPEYGLRAVARRFQQDGYRHLYITGTVRPFSYYLAHHEAIGIEFHESMEGEVAMSITGLPGSRWVLLAGGMGVYLLFLVLGMVIGGVV